MKPGVARRARRGVVLLAALGTALAVLPGVASASGETVSGRASDPAGAGLADVCVAVVSSAASGGTAATTRTAADGTYSLNAYAGSFYLRFTDCAGGDLVTRYWPNAARRDLGTVITLASGEQRAGVNVTMSRGGSMSGTVTNTSGEPIADAHVDIRPASDITHPYPVETDVRTDAQGRYVARGLPAGAYRVVFSGYMAYTAILYGDTADGARSPDVDVVAGVERSGVDAVLTRPATISGVVRDDQGNPFPDQCVRVAGGTARGSREHWARSATDGSYTVKNVAAGTYKVEFSDCTGVTAATWYPAATTYAAGTGIVVAESASVTAIDGVLTPGLSITGTVRDQHGAPVEGVTVLVYDGLTGLSTGRQESTDAEGRYRLTGLRGTVYKLQFDGCCRTGDFVTRWWPNAQARAAAAPVSLVAGVSLVDVDMVLPRGGRITGTVRNEAGQPVANVCAVAWSVTSGVGRSGRTDALGRYVVRALDSGEHRVAFSSCGAGNIAPAYYGGVDDPATAELVPVALEAETGGIDQVARPGGTISGRVTDAAGNLLAGICVRADSPRARMPGSNRQTDSDGRYLIDALAPHADYRVRFTDCLRHPSRYIPAWNGGGDDYDAAPLLDVRGGEVVTADGTMVRGGSASGTVFDQFGLPLHGICVNVIRTDYRASGTSRTGQGGDFSVGGLKPGTYKAYFYDCGAGVVSSVWAPGVVLEADARTFEVTEGTDTPGVDTTIIVITTPKAPLNVTVTPGDGTATVTWQPPSDTGHSPLTGFEVRKADGAVVTSTDASARGARLTGLANGTTYSFTVNAVNAKGAGDPSGAVSVLPRQAARITLAGPATVVSGSVVSLTGRLVTMSGAAVPGAPLGLYARRKGSTAAMTRLSSATTTSTGAYSVAVRPAYPMEYSIRYAGSSAITPVAATRSLAVSPRVTIATSGRLVFVTVSPASGGGTARLQVWRSTGWANGASVSVSSTGRASLRAPSGGLFRVIVMRHGWTTGVSRSVRVA